MQRRETPLERIARLMVTRARSSRWRSPRPLSSCEGWSLGCLERRPRVPLNNCWRRQAAEPRGSRFRGWPQRRLRYSSPVAARQPELRCRREPSGAILDAASPACSRRIFEAKLPGEVTRQGSRPEPVIAAHPVEVILSRNRRASASRSASSATSRSSSLAAGGSRSRPAMVG